MATEHLATCGADNDTQTLSAFRAPTTRLVERHASAPWSAAEQRRLVELLCTGIERLTPPALDFPADVSVDADVPEEGRP